MLASDPVSDPFVEPAVPGAPASAVSERSSRRRNPIAGVGVVAAESAPVHSGLRTGSSDVRILFHTAAAVPPAASAGGPCVLRPSLFVLFSPPLEWV